MAAEDAPMCAAMSRPLIPGKPSSYVICTQDQGHKGNHTACGQGGQRDGYSSVRAEVTCGACLGGG